MVFHDKNILYGGKMSITYFQDKVNHFTPHFVRSFHVFLQVGGDGTECFMGQKMVLRIASAIDYYLQAETLQSELIPKLAQPHFPYL